MHTPISLFVSIFITHSIVHAYTYTSLYFIIRTLATATSGHTDGCALYGDLANSRSNTRTKELFLSLGGDAISIYTCIPGSIDTSKCVMHPQIEVVTQRSQLKRINLMILFRVTF